MVDSSISGLPLCLHVFVDLSTDIRAIVRDLSILARASPALAIYFFNPPADRNSFQSTEITASDMDVQTRSTMRQAAMNSRNPDRTYQGLPDTSDRPSPIRPSNDRRRTASEGGDDGGSGGRRIFPKLGAGSTSGRIAATAPTNVANTPAELDKIRFKLRSKEVLSPGRIVRVKHVEDHFRNSDPAYPVNPKNSFYIPEWGFVSCKERKMVILQVFEEHIVALPVLTFNGKGIRFLAQSTQQEYISIRDGRPDGPTCIQQNSFKPIVAMLNPGIKPLKPLSVVRYTFSISVSLKRALVLEGKIIAESLQTLQNLHYKHLGDRYNATQPPKDTALKRKRLT